MSPSVFFALINKGHAEKYEDWEGLVFVCQWYLHVISTLHQVKMHFLFIQVTALFTENPWEICQ